MDKFNWSEFLLRKSIKDIFFDFIKTILRFFKNLVTIYSFYTKIFLFVALIIFWKPIFYFLILRLYYFQPTSLLSIASLIIILFLFAIFSFKKIHHYVGTETFVAILAVLVSVWIFTWTLFVNSFDAGINLKAENYYNLLKANSILTSRDDQVKYQARFLVSKYPDYWPWVDKFFSGECITNFTLAIEGMEISNDIAKELQEVDAGAINIKNTEDMRRFLLLHDSKETLLLKNVSIVKNTLEHMLKNCEWGI